MPCSGAFGRTPRIHTTSQLSNWIFPAINEKINPGGILPLLLSKPNIAPSRVRWYTDSGTLLAERTEAPWGAMVYNSPEFARLRCEVITNGTVRQYWRNVNSSRAIPSGYIVNGSPVIAILPNETAPIGSGYCAVATNRGSLGGMFKAYPVAAVDYPIITTYPDIVDSAYGVRSENLLPMRTATRNNDEIKVFGSDGTNNNRQLRTTLSLAQTRFTHDGTGCSIYAIVCQTEASSFEIFGSATGNPPGFSWAISSSGHLTINVWEASGQMPVNFVTSAALTLNTTYAVSLTWNASGGEISIYNGSSVIRETFSILSALSSGVDGGTPLYIARSLVGYQGATLVFSTRHTTNENNAQLSALWIKSGNVSSYAPATGRRVLVRGDCWSVGTWDVSYQGPSGNGWATYGWQSYLPDIDCEVISLGKFENAGLTDPTYGIAALADTEVYPLITEGTFVPFQLDGDDIVYHGATASSLSTAVTNYLASLQDLGAVTFRTTMCPRVSHYSPSSWFEGIRVDYNNLTRTTHNAANIYLDMDSIFVQIYGGEMGDGVLYSNGGSGDDFAHPTDLGYRLWGHLIGNAWKAYLSNKTSVPYTGALPATLSGAQGSATLSVNGSNRDMIVYRPSHLPANSPLVIYYHGTGEDPSSELYNMGAGPVADGYGFLLIAPAARHNVQGRADDVDHWDTFTNYSSSWNLWDGNANVNDDVMFTRALIDAAASAYGIDKKRVYVMGKSNGAFFSPMVALLLQNEIAAFGENSGGAMRAPNRGEWGDQWEGTSLTVAGLEAEANFPTYANGTLRPVPVPTIGRVPHGYLVHYNDDFAVSVAWSCHLYDSMGSNAHIKILHGGGHALEPNFLSNAWADISGFSLP